MSKAGRELFSTTLRIFSSQLSGLSNTGLGVNAMPYYVKKIHGNYYVYRKIYVKDKVVSNTWILWIESPNTT